MSRIRLCRRSSCFLCPSSFTSPIQRPCFRRSSYIQPKSGLHLRHCSTTPMSRVRLHRRLLSSTSPPSPSWSPRDAFAAATERVRAGTLSRDDAHHMFDELFRQATPVPERSLNGFLAALARATSSSACITDGPALALALFNRVCREEAGTQVAVPTFCTYSILMDCCCRARRPDLGLALFGCILRAGLKIHQITANTLLKCLCYADRTEEAVNVLLHRMSELGCVLDSFSYSIILKALCDNSMSQRALDLFQMMAKQGGRSCYVQLPVNIRAHAGLSYTLSCCQLHWWSLSHTVWRTLTLLRGTEKESEHLLDENFLLSYTVVYIPLQFWNPLFSVLPSNIKM
ncbi:hypothetical protein ZWY2020_037330 [Hordeum vulgare]|nr:hypothetical protein ZWY2020_037330 [Hordeum vulgare]